MSKEITQCEKLGYKVGDKFKVVDGTGCHYEVGSFITLIRDDGSSCPRFNGVHAIYESGDSFFPLDFVEKVAKLKPAKQALADAIHQNGGWSVAGDCNFATSNRSGVVKFFNQNPLRNGADWVSCPYSLSWIVLHQQLPNWHQTILSREEYYQAYPKADDDGWIEWSGGECPVDASDEVDTKHRAGRVDVRRYANSAWWYHTGGIGDIVAYRLHKPEVKPEFCESVMRSIPGSESIDELCAKVTEENKHQHVDAKPTIEQLAQDYRNAREYAERLQKDADEAKDKSEEIKELLIKSGTEIGIVISIGKAGDEIEYKIGEKWFLASDLKSAGWTDEQLSDYASR